MILNTTERGSRSECKHKILQILDCCLFCVYKQNCRDCKKDESTKIAKMLVLAKQIQLKITKEIHLAGEEIHRMLNFYRKDEDDESSSNIFEDSFVEDVNVRNSLFCYRPRGVYLNKLRLHSF